jgi:hypothetical protein
VYYILGDIQEDIRVSWYYVEYTAVAEHGCSACSIETGCRIGTVPRNIRKLFRNT